MSDDKYPGINERTVKAVYQFLPGFLAEVDHNVSAEYDVKAFFKIKRFCEIETSKRDKVAKPGIDHIPHILLFKVLAQNVG